MQGIYRLAGHTVEIVSLYPLVHAMCADYRADGPAEYRIVITSADVQDERVRAERQVLPDTPSYALTEPYLEASAVYRKLSDQLVQDDILLMHGSVVAVDGQAYLFTAKSGTGKSTHTQLWMQQFGQRAVMVNGDKPLLYVGSSGVTVYGTPWNGKEGLGHNIACPLKAICILTRSAHNHIAPITKHDALPMLCQQIHRPASPAALGRVLQLIDRLGSSVPLYKLGCNMEPEAAQVAYTGMNPA